MHSPFMSPQFASPNSSPGLPPRLRVPPTLPHIHKRLRLGFSDDGVLLFPEDGSGLLFRWGVSGRVDSSTSQAEHWVEVAGVIGVVTLWESRHLLLVMPSPPSYIFTSTKSRAVHTVRQVLALHLERSPAKDIINRLCNVNTGYKWPFGRNEVDQLRSSNPTREELEAKIVGQIIREFESGGFMYAYDFDLSRPAQNKGGSGNALASLAQLLDHPAPPEHLPLWRRVDKRFWWNEHLAQPLIDGGHHAFVLPILQGVMESTTFAIPVPTSPSETTATPVDYAVISRRSRDRAGLRYQRRGIDDDGHVANFVETEMLVRATVEGKESLFSFIQVRGSIPLRWSQSPWSTKPPPVLDAPVGETYSVAALHFDDLKRRYGPVTVVNISEQTGKEGTVTNAYGELAESLGDIKYIAWDFHAHCKGMRWEKISTLIDQLDLDGQGFGWVLDGERVREQQGVFRTNCIDCLDRTGVLQSAIARRMLGLILTQLGMVAEGIDRQFNEVWANTGDIISVCYAHTSALKGDFVRRGKRDLAGMLNDGVSSLSRMYYGAFSDYRAQAVISYMLGQRSLNVFSQLLEQMAVEDTASLVRLSRLRAAAVEVSSSRVLEGETRQAGWTLLSPEQPNTKLSTALEEKVVLLTHVALYVVSFNYSLEKVSGYTRIPLGSITKIQKGAYILSSLQEAGRDARENAGFVVYFSRHQSRFSTYSVRNDFEGSDGQEFFAFKVLPREFSSGLDDLDSDTGPTETCQEVVERLVDRIVEESVKAGGEPEVVQEDVVSVREASESIGLLARVDYAVKRLLWL